MLFENFKNYYILRYVIYEFLKKVLGVPQPTCLVRVFCAMYDRRPSPRQLNQGLAQAHTHNPSQKSKEYFPIHRCPKG